MVAGCFWRFVRLLLLYKIIRFLIIQFFRHTFGFYICDVSIVTESRRSVLVDICLGVYAKYIFLWILGGLDSLGGGNFVSCSLLIFLPHFFSGGAEIVDGVWLVNRVWFIVRIALSRFDLNMVWSSRRILFFICFMWRLFRFFICYTASSNSSSSTRLLSLLTNWIGWNYAMRRSYAHFLGIIWLVLLLSLLDQVLVFFQWQNYDSIRLSPDVPCFFFLLALDRTHKHTRPAYRPHSIKLNLVRLDFNVFICFHLAFAQQNFVK